MQLNYAFYKKFVHFTLLICALCGGCFFLTGSHIPKYVVFVLCLLAMTGAFLTKEKLDLNFYIKSYRDFFIPWLPWLFSVIVLVLFFNGLPESSEFFNAFLIMFFVFGALFSHKFSRSQVMTYLAAALFLVSIAVVIQILTIGISPGGSVIGTNKNKVLGISSALTICCLASLLFEGNKYSRNCKLLIVAAIIASMSAIIMAEVRTAILPFLALIPFVCIFKRKDIKAIVIVIAAAVVLLTLSFLTGRMQQGITDLQQYEAGVTITSWGLRLEMWKLAIEAFWDAPFFGWGKEPYDAMAASGHVMNIPDFKFYHFHNDFFNALTAGGLFEVACWLLTIILMARKSWKDPAALCLLLGVLSAGLTERYWFHRITLFAFVTLWTLLYISNSHFWSSSTTPKKNSEN